MYHQQAWGEILQENVDSVTVTVTVPTITTGFLWMLCGSLQFYLTTFMQLENKKT